MTVEETYLKDCYVISPRIFEDSRGQFFESFNKLRFEEITGVTTEFVQDNQSISKKGTLRGLHLQIGKHQQAKLVNVVVGKVLDVCVDLRKDSKTFGEHFSLILDASEHKQLFVPKGFAHGFVALSEKVIFSYKCDNYYNKASERGIIYNDQTLNIDWNYPESELILSEKDKSLPTFQSYCNESQN